VAYQRILQLTYVDDLLAALKTLFVKMFQPFLATFVASLHAINSGKATIVEAASVFSFADAFDGWDKMFDKLLRSLEDKAAQVRSNFCLILPVTLTAGDRTENHACARWCGPRLRSLVPPLQKSRRHVSCSLPRTASQ
jgi:hypothetical protein